MLLPPVTGSGFEGFRRNRLWSNRFVQPLSLDWSFWGQKFVESYQLELIQNEGIVKENDVSIKIRNKIEIYWTYNDWNKFDALSLMCSLGKLSFKPFSC